MQIDVYNSCVLANVVLFGRLFLNCPTATTKSTENRAKNKNPANKGQKIVFKIQSPFRLVVRDAQQWKMEKRKKWPRI